MKPVTLVLCRDGRLGLLPIKDKSAKGEVAAAQQNLKGRADRCRCVKGLKRSAVFLTVSHRRNTPDGVTFYPIYFTVKENLSCFKN